MKNLEKTVCYILRHKPEEFGVTLDKNGWTSIDELTEGVNRKLSANISQADIESMVKRDSKGRYSVLDDKIRCNFGHSVEVIIEDTEQAVPDILYHGTAKRFLKSIKEKGLVPNQRASVHLTDDKEVAIQVGMRYAKSKDNLVLLEIDTKRMQADGYVIQTTGTSTYLTERVPAEYLI